MKVFISWSGPVSHKVAQALSDWLPSVVQQVQPLFSSEHVRKGAGWFESIGKELEATNVGILCLTKENLTAPWILYEAGALGKHQDKA